MDVGVAGAWAHGHFWRCLVTAIIVEELSWPDFVEEATVQRSQVFALGFGIILLF